MFLTTVVVGAVSLCGEFHLMERPFLRDVIFYIGAVFFTFYICTDHKITLVESIGTYAYVVTLVVVSFMSHILKNKTRSSATALIAHDADDVETAIQGHSRSSNVVPIDVAYMTSC